MGLLDELEQEAERRRAEDAREQGEREERERLWSERLEPAMHELEAYLRQLTEQLVFIKRRPRVVYSVPPYGDVVAYVEPAFTVHGAAPVKHSYEITVEFSATVASDECPLIQEEATPRLKSLIATLQHLRISGLSDVRKNPNGEIIAARIQAKGKIPLAVHIHADMAGGLVKMTFTNLEGLGTSSRTFRPDHLTSALYDALGRFIARDEQRFAQESVPDDVRKQLQTRIQHDQLKREWEGRLQRHLAKDEDKVLDSLGPGVEPGSLVGRIKLFARRLIGR